MASFESGCLLPNDIMFLLDTAETIGMTRIDRTSKLVSRNGVVDTERLPVRAPTWAEASEPPRMPLFYGRMMSIDF